MVYDQYGQLITALQPDRLNMRGEHILNWDTGSLTPGLYSVCLRAGGVVQGQKVIVQP